MASILHSEGQAEDMGSQIYASAMSCYAPFPLADLFIKARGSRDPREQ